MLGMQFDAGSDSSWPVQIVQVGLVCRESLPYLNLTED